MAMWKQQVVLPLVPPKLREFDPRDGWNSIEQWSDARFEWLLAHPDRDIDGADLVDVVFDLD